MELINQTIFSEDHAARYRQAAPFPHAVLRGLWDENFLKGLAHETKSFDFFDGEKDFYGASRKRYCGTMTKLPPTVRQLIEFSNSQDFLRMLEAMTGEENLVADPYLEGGGMHRILPGGFLKVHADFNWHRKLGLYRRLNMLVYLNPSWDSQWGGDLQLWQRDMLSCSARIYPELNTTVVFTTDDTSFHGHPNPLVCPDGVTRDSIALYYYSDKKPQDEQRAVRETTDYRARDNSDIRVKLGKASEKLRLMVPGKKS